MPDSRTAVSTAPSTTAAAVFASATIVSSVRGRDASGPRPLALVTPRRRPRRVTFASGVVTLGEFTLVALAVPLMVIALPVVLLARLLLTIVWAIRGRTAGVGPPFITGAEQPRDGP